MKIIDHTLDFETMGTDPDSIVLSCAITFHERGKLDYTFEELVEKTHYFKFELEHQQKDFNRTYNERTLEWWQKQDPEVRKSQFSPSEYDFTLGEFITAYYNLLEQYGSNNNSMAFCRGQSFDFPILKNIHQSVRNSNPDFFPVPFWQQTDIRSVLRGLMMDLTVRNIPMPDGTLKGFKKHDPIHDNAKAILEMQWAYRYADGEDLPEYIDPESI